MRIGRPVGCALLALVVTVEGRAAGDKPPPYGVGPPEPARIRATYTLPDVPLGLFQDARLPGSISDDGGLLLGGTGSDLFRDPTDPEGTYWMITDRGPNPEIRKGGRVRRTFSVPELMPVLDGVP